ncbi:MAG: hypothetical protein QM808_06335 [Steroidobacteraceae bacterium]
MNKTLYLLPTLLLGAMSMNSAQAACNDGCLNKQLDKYLTQLVKHDPAPLSVAANAITIENAKPVKLGEGSWQAVQSLPVAGHRFTDASTGQVVYYGATKQADGKIGSMFLRLKIADNKITESELFTKGAYTAEGMETGGLLEPDILYPTVVPKERRSTA